MSRAATWDIYAWLGAGTCVVLVLFGAFVTARPPREAEVDGQRLRHGDSSDLRGKWRLGARAPGVLMLFFGAFGLLRQQRAPEDFATQLGFGLLCLALGSWLVFFQDRHEAWRRRRYQARLDDRLARGEDAYFEELREIRAYPPDRLSRLQQRLFGAVMILLGLSFLALAVTK